jgi:DNA gyrase/topoisomerase IV subunit A
MIDWIESLTPNEKEAFLTFCKKHSSPIQMYLYARFLGFTGNIVDCDEWQQKEFKKRNLQQILELEIDNMREDVEKLRQAIDMGLVKQDNGTARIAMLQKELRGAIKQIQDEKYLTDKQGLILAGADRALREVVLIFRDDPIEGPLQDAVMAVWTKILAEES